MKTKEGLFKASFMVGLFLVVLLCLVSLGFAEGILDESFGANQDGLVTTEVGAAGGRNLVNSLALQPDSKYRGGRNVPDANKLSSIHPGPL